jgi:hypothetical protein
MENKKKKYVSNDVVMKDLQKTINNPEKKRKVVNKELKVVLVKMVNKVIIKHARVEAMKLLNLATEHEIGEFLYYYHSDKHNVCCMVLDSIKDRLHKFNKLPARIGNNFGLFCKPGFIGTAS